MRERQPRQKAWVESRREREFYRYYQPIRDLSGAGESSFCDLYNEEAARNHRPRSCPDPALTAFCQLGALRLATKRAMLFFFDLNYAYVLAEATRSLSLQDDSIHDFEDDLWLGHTVVPRGLSICEATVMLGGDRSPPSTHSSFFPALETAGSRSPVHIINDLAADTRFCDRPFVSGGPKARFYAGVPITTPRGINIGAYCVLDDKKRDGLHEKEIQFLRDMAATVMTHLDMARASAEAKRGAKMVSGLGSFIDGAAQFREKATATVAARRGVSKSRLESSEREAEEQSLITHLDGSPIIDSTNSTAVASMTTTSSTENPIKERKQPKHHKSSAMRASNNDRMSTMQHSDDLSGPVSGTKSVSIKKRIGRNSNDLDEDSTSSDIQKVFQIAANLIQEAIEVDGVVFLDTATSQSGSFTDHSGVFIEHGTDRLSNDLADIWATEDSTMDASKPQVPQKRSRSDQRGRAEKKYCRTLARSIISNPENALDNNDEDLQNIRDEACAAVSKQTLHTLLRRYPKGKVWYFNQLGSVSDESSGTESENESSANLCECPEPLHPAQPFNHEPSCFLQGRPANTGMSSLFTFDESRDIHAAFPNARSVAVVGMWDHNRGRWYAACAFWSHSPLRLFSDEFEGKYVSAFCDVILAELQRLEAETSDRAKSDFISTISHELRSPLHGILGTVECLQENQEIDTQTAELVTQIELCGRTLIDIIDHLLDFSKINHQSRIKSRSHFPRKRRSKSSSITRGSADFSGTGNTGSSPVSSADYGLEEQHPQRQAQQQQESSFMSSDANIPLDLITEETVETAVYSFCCSRDPAMILNQRKVDVILDIDRASNIDWRRCNVATGAWKRIVINLVSNALKYTQEGHVRIAMSAVNLSTADLSGETGTPSRRRSQIQDTNGGGSGRLKVTFSVSDTGRGMSKAFLERDLFRAFSQEDSFVEGTGLGLNLVAKIVKALDGTIEVQSEKNVGSCFVVCLVIEQGRKLVKPPLPPSLADQPQQPLPMSPSFQDQGRETRNGGLVSTPLPSPLRNKFDFDPPNGAAGRALPLLDMAIGIVDPHIQKHRQRDQHGQIATASTATRPSRGLILTNIKKIIQQAGGHPVRTDWHADSDDQPVRAHIVLESDFIAQFGAPKPRPDSAVNTPSPPPLIPEHKPSLLAGRSLIVICDTELSARKVRASNVAKSMTAGGVHPQQIIVVVSQPVGPERLIRAILTSVEKEKDAAIAASQADATLAATTANPLMKSGEETAFNLLSAPPARTPQPTSHLNSSGANSDPTSSKRIQYHSTSPQSSVPSRSMSINKATAVPVVAHLNPAAVGRDLHLDLRIKLKNDTTGEIKHLSATTPLSETEQSNLVEKQKPATGKDVVVGITATPTDSPADIHSAPLPPSKQIGGQDASGKKQLDILLVDDNPINVQLLKTYLTKRKHRSVTATNGLEAVEIYQSACDASVASSVHVSSTPLPQIPLYSPAAATSTSAASPSEFSTPQPTRLPSPSAHPRPRVILMDINMPVLDGFEATRRIRACEKALQIHEPAVIIALTGLGSAMAQEEAFASGVDLFLTKPVRLRELSTILEGLE